MALALEQLGKGDIISSLPKEDGIWVRPNKIQSAILSAAPIAGELSLAGNAVATAVAVTQTDYEVAPATVFRATTSNIGTPDFDQSAVGRLRYLGAKPRLCLVRAELTVQGTAAAVVDYFFKLAIDGTVNANTVQKVTTPDAAEFVHISLMALLTLNQNEYVSVFVSNDSGTQDVLVDSITLTALGLIK